MLSSSSLRFGDLDFCFFDREVLLLGDSIEWLAWLLDEFDLDEDESASLWTLEVLFASD